VVDLLQAKLYPDRMLGTFPYSAHPSLIVFFYCCIYFMLLKDVMNMRKIAVILNKGSAAMVV